MARDLDLNKVVTAEGAINCMKAVVDQYRDDASNLDSSDMDGRPWIIIADELEKAITRMEKRVYRIYPRSHRKQLNQR